MQTCAGVASHLQGTAKCVFFLANTSRDVQMATRRVHILLPRIRWMNVIFRLGRVSVASMGESMF